ncbi:MBL fold metallo-hydrolase [Porticoccaceae bacterium LTM1]|nr:MBL fold metallo-hydrolase [Porticoccaceae bacterium LTM1]
MNTRVWALSLLLSGSAFADHHDQFADVTIETIPVAEGIYMMTGSGGNLGVSIGEDGTFLIDDQFAPLTEKIMAAIHQAGGETPRFLLNTHWHGDHTGGNEHFGNAGAIIVAHDNVRERLTKEQFVKAFNMKSDPQPKAALPVITFAESMTLHWNNDELSLQHQANAHTDGDAWVHFQKANVIHAGDIYFAGMYPFIDPDSGGSIKGMIEAVGELLAVADDETKIIPGHGPLSNKLSLSNYREMLKLAYQRIKKMKDDGLSQEQVVAAKPTADLDEEWGNGFLKPDQWVGIVYQGI